MTIKLDKGNNLVAVITQDKYNLGVAGAVMIFKIKGGEKQEVVFDSEKKVRLVLSDFLLNGVLGKEFCKYFEC